MKTWTQRKWLGWAIPIFISLVILAPILGGWFLLKRNLDRLSTMSHLIAIDDALDNFFLDQESYPGGDAGALVEVLEGGNATKTPYLKIFIQETGHAVDPWGSPYKILNRTSDGRPLIYSIGPNRRDERCNPDFDDIKLPQK